jgi:XTP/dITP diphosphohydrolase
LVNTPSPQAGETRTVLASGNPGKLAELQVMLRGLGMEIVAQSHFSVPDAEETGLTFVENALIKARHCARHTGLPAIADDSGLVVDALHGAPGIYSARYAGTAAGDAQNVQKLLTDLKEVPQPRRTARFHCVLIYLRDALDPMPVIGEGTWEGRVLEAPAGDGGFGYDPVFYVPDHGCSAAQLAAAVKHRISHRGQALARLAARLGMKA